MLNHNFKVGQIVRVERCVIYSSSYNSAKMQESEKTIKRVSDTGVMFEGSKIWYHIDGEYFSARNMKFRYVDYNPAS